MPCCLAWLPVPPRLGNNDSKDSSWCKRGDRRAPGEWRKGTRGEEEAGKEGRVENGNEEGSRRLRGHTVPCSPDSIPPSITPRPKQRMPASHLPPQLWLKLSSLLISNNYLLLGITRISLLLACSKEALPSKSYLINFQRSEDKKYLDIWWIFACAFNLLGGDKYGDYQGRCSNHPN